jgi:hypothetical protein
LAFNIHGFHAFAGMTGGGFRPCATNNGQFDKLTDRTEGAPAPELVEGPHPLRLRHPRHPAPSSPSRMRRSSLSSACAFSFRVYASVFSVFFRVNPWQMLLLPCPTVGLK